MATQDWTLRVCSQASPVNNQKAIALNKGASLPAGGVAPAGRTSQCVAFAADPAERRTRVGGYLQQKHACMRASPRAAATPAAQRTWPATT